MTVVWPLKFRAKPDGTFLFADDAGGWFVGNHAFLDRYAQHHLTAADIEFLSTNGHAFEEDDLEFTSFAYRWSQRQHVAEKLDYVILIPTLRCNLSCGYCQVSRAAEQAKGYDWSAATLTQVLTFLDGLQTDFLKIEFQGGEPLLRLDHLEAVRDFCRRRFKSVQFTVCTNLQSVADTAWSFLSSADTFVSTSLDGDFATHRRQRTGTSQATITFQRNLRTAIDRLGDQHLSALPTIDVNHPPVFEELVDTYAGLGLQSIYFRPVNHQGFARRRKEVDIGAWNALHDQFIEFLIARNWKTGEVIEEYYFSHCLRRVLAAPTHNHVDLRNPNPVGCDYVVVDYDGVLYPTDEARMLARIGRIDLSIGHVANGIDSAKTAHINASALNHFDPDCVHCPYQAFCGIDLVDDISRYGRIDKIRVETWFCRRHMHLFDKIFELIYRNDPATEFSLSRWAGLSSWPRLMRSRAP